jgi:16S rRNA (adenine1518-N6/adenine1519-N6)-dimethyltransferase
MALLQKLSISPEDISAKIIFEKFPGRITKAFGQNYIFDKKINDKIVSSAGDLTNKIIVEIGPGAGGLTLEILKRNIKKLYVVEVDPHWASVWRELKALFGNKLEAIECDALKFDTKSILPNLIIANLPYNISSKLLCKWLPEIYLYDQLVLMFQKEVAERLYAESNTKAYGKLSILAQCSAQVLKMFDLESGSFFPSPKVKSTIVKFIPFMQNQCITLEKYNLLSNLLAKAFAHRRKILVKSLGEFFRNPEYVLKNLGYNINVRAEQIAVRDYIKMLECTDF